MTDIDSSSTRSEPGKVAAVTFGFWVVKVLATTLGETGGDWVSMSLDLGYLVGSLIFAAIFLALVGSQVRAARFRPALFWATIVATTTLGTTMADFADRSLGVGYPGGVATVAALLAASLLIWRRVEGTVSVSSIDTPRAEWFYWCTILFSQTLGTALGDWLAGTDRGGLGLGYEYGALVFGLGLGVVAALCIWTAVSRTMLFWAAFILTRPLGATLGDLLDKPVSDGGLNFSRWLASLVLLAGIVACIAFFPQRAARKERRPDRRAARELSSPGDGSQPARPPRRQVQRAQGERRGAVQAGRLSGGLAHSSIGMMIAKVVVPMFAPFLPHDLDALGAIVLLLGVKHGFDADHLATIDGLTRAAATGHPRWARACGALFALGHGGVVIAGALTFSHAASVWQVPDWLTTCGAWVSIAFLIALGLLNIASVLQTPADEVVAFSGLRQRLLRRLRGADSPRARHPLWALPIGALFAVSFDTLSQTALFSAAAGRTGAWQGAALCALLFTTGMLLTDGLNGLWISRILRHGGAAARIASRLMGLGVGAASLLIAAVGVARQSSSTVDAWLGDREPLLGAAVIALVLCASMMSLRGAGRRSLRG